MENYTLDITKIPPHREGEITPSPLREYPLRGDR